MKKLIIAGILFLPLTSHAQTSLEPIVLVPGIMGSWNWEVMTQGGGAGSWDFFPIDHTWDSMFSALEDAGYERDVNLFVAFYDWRQSNINSATDFLIPTIDEALENSPTGKVDIIAHSMGGLVARRYIQSDDYRNDVDQLIMLGTPNHGSSDVYTLWEGGAVPKNWDKSSKYVIGSYLWYMNTATAQTADNYDTIHTFIPSVGELLPVYDFLLDSDESFISYGDLIEGQNSFLENLNFGGTGTELQALGGITVIAGKGEATVANIPVVDRPESETKLWTDGMPEPITPVRDNTEGDNRVLTDSAFINNVVFPISPAQNFWDKFLATLFPSVYAEYDGGNEEDFLKQIEIDSKHGDLPTTAIDEVFTALNVPIPGGDYPVPVEPDNITSFWFASPVEVKVTDPNGNVITKNSNNIPGAVYTGESDPNGVKMVIIPDGAPGVYEVELMGTADGEYHMAGATFTDTADNIVTVEKDIEEGEKVEYTIDVNHVNSLIEISDPVITEPESDSPIDMTEDLIADVKTYYQDGKIKDKKVYQALQLSLKVTLNALLADKPKIATISLYGFIGTIKISPRKIDSAAASDLIAKAKAIIAEID